MLWLLLLASQNADALDLIDLLDDVDLVTRDRIEAAITRERDLSDLVLTFQDVALAPQSRDGAIDLAISVGHDLFAARTRTTVLLHLAVDFDVLLLAPPPAAPPPDERRRLTRCLEIEGAPPMERHARFSALGCGR